MVPLASSGHRADSGSGLQDDWLRPEGSHPRRRAMGWVAAIGLLAVASGTWYMLAHRPEPVSYTTARVVRGPIESKVTASGTLSALVTVQVGSQVSGRIAQIFVDFNSLVRKGEILARIDPQLLDAALAQSRANYEVATANLQRDVISAQDLDRQAYRAGVLARENLGAKADAQTARASARQAHALILAARAAIGQAQANLSQAEINLAYCTIRSPIDGMVISRNVDVGQTVAASLQAPTLFEIAENLRRMQVDTSVAEADVGRLKTGMPAQFTVDAYPDQTFTGRVRQIRNAPQTVQNVVTYDAVIDVANPQLELKPGMTANVTFIDASRSDAVLVPSAAFRFHPFFSAGRHPWRSGSPGAGLPIALPPDERFVWTLADAKPHRVRVRIGITDGIDTEIVSGRLHPGDRVITDQAAEGPVRGGPRRMFL